MLFAEVAPGGSLSWIELAMLIFMGVFVLIVIRVLLARRGAFNRAANLPMDDSPPPTPTAKTRDGRPTT